MTAASPETREPRPAEPDRTPAQAADSTLPSGDFFHELLARAIDCAGGVAAAAWGLTPQGVLAQVAAIRFAETGPAQSAAAARQHIQLLLEVLHRGQARIHRAEATASSPPQMHHVLLLAPLVRQVHCVGVLEVFLRAETAEEDLAPRLAALNRLSQTATRQLESRSLLHPHASGDEFQHRLMAFIQQLHRDLRVSSVALTTVNEGRLVLGCERASLVVVRRNKTEVLAISGQDRVRERSNLARAMKELATLVVSTGQPLQYEGTVADLPPDVQQPLVSYLAESGAARLTALPLYPPPPTSAGDSEASEPADALGVLVLEWFSDGTSENRAEHEQAAAAHAAQALQNALLHEGEFLSPLWRSLHRRLTAAERATRKRRGLCAACACVGLVLLLFMPVPNYVHAEGELVPVIHLGVFAPEDGEVVEVVARGGERIERGELLVRLCNDALASEHLQAQNRLTETEQSLVVLVAQRGEAVEKGARDAAIRLEGRIAQAEVEVDGIRRRLASLERELARLEVRSPVSGTVATFQPTQQLLNRPVRRGELLVEVMDENGPWRLELAIPASRLGHVLAVVGPEGEQRLPVRFTLATMPERSFEGVVHRLGTTMDAAEDGTPVLLAQAAIDAAEIPIRTSGSEVSARIYCGRESFACWLLGDAFDFVRRRVW